MKISAVISCYNEEKNIENCLKSVVWVDEIILVDNTSIDKTCEIAKKYTSKIFKRPNNLMLNINKNYGFSKATGDWILNLDADEIVTLELKEEILSMIGSSEVNGYWIPRKNIIFGKWIKNDMWWPDYQLRLFKRGEGRFEEKHVHEKLEINGETAKIKEPMIHNNYSSISQYLFKMDKIYTENEVELILSSDKKLNWLDSLRYPVNDFLKTFFAQKGYKDGLHGLVLSMLQAFYAEIVFAKVWERQGFKEENSDHFLEDFYKEFRKIIKEFQFWFLTSFIDKTKSPFKKIEFKIRKKIFR